MSEPGTVAPAAVPRLAARVLPRRAPRTGWRRALAHGGFAFGAAVLVVFLVAAVAGPSLVPGDAFHQDLAHRLTPPVWLPKGSWAHPLGTDKFGRDMLARLVLGARISLAIGLAAMLISGVIGSVLGILAGYFGGTVDAVVGFVITTRLSLPVALVATAVAALAGSSLGMIIAVLGCLIWDRFAVVLRSTCQRLRDLDFIAAAQACGCSSLRIIAAELLPNVVGYIVVIATLELAHAILLEATLSFLGLGVQAPLPSLGLMIAEGKGYMFFMPWVIAVPGVTLFCLVLGINLFGDGLRDLMAVDRNT